MRFCPECGAIVAPEDVFCSYCGISLPRAEAAAPDEETAASADDAPTVAAAETSGANENAAAPAPRRDLWQETPSFLKSVENQTDLAIKAAMRFESAAPPQNRVTTENDAAENNLPFENSLIENSLIENPVVADWFAENSIAAPAENKIIEQDVKSVDSISTKADDSQSSDEPETMLGKSLAPPARESKANSIEPGANRDSFATDSNDFSSTAAPNAAPNKSAEVSQDASGEDFQATLISLRSAGAPPDKAESEPETIFRKPNQTPLLNQVQPQEAPLIAQDAQTPASNREIAQTPAANNTGDKQRQETPGGKSARLKLLDDGTILNRRYEIVRRIGGGGMGAVYLAKDQNLGGAQRAVKEMIQAYVDESQQEKAVQDFRRESLLLSQLEHPSIPTIYDYFYDEDAGRFYLVMKYIAGGDLASRLRQTPGNRIDEPSVAQWAMQVADVLDYLHNQQQPIVYRDLKPSNIMLDANGKRAMLIDFGIARFVNKEEKGVTAVGTMGYAPPELFAGNAEPRSDIYSLGATMFHLLTGADPQSNPLLIFDFTKNPRPRDVNPSLSVEIEDILLRSVEYNAALRFESAAKMRDALALHLENLKAGRLTFERRKQMHGVAAPPKYRQPVVARNSAKLPLPNLVFCGFCGEKIVATDAFCAYCGAPQQVAQGAQPFAGNSTQLDQTMLSAKLPGAGKPSQTARLVVLGTRQLDEPIFPLDKESNLIGREDRRSNIFPEVDLTKFDDPADARISRRHAKISRSGEQFMIEDLRSANGTLLITEDNNHVRLQPNQPHVLNNGDKLKLGKTTLRFFTS